MRQRGRSRGERAPPAHSPATALRQLQTFTCSPETDIRRVWSNAVLRPSLDLQRAKRDRAWRGSRKLADRHQQYRAMGGMMEGQWIGRFAGTNPADVHVDIDAIDGSLNVSAQVFDDDADLLGILARFSVPAGLSTYKTDVALTPLDPQAGWMLSHADLQQRYPGVTVPSVATVTLDHTAARLRATWTTPIGIRLARRPGCRPPAPRSCQPVAEGSERLPDHRQANSAV